MGSRLRQLTDPLREFGVVAGCLYGIDRVFALTQSRFRIHNYELMVQPVRAEPLVPPSLGKSIDVRELGPGDAALESTPVPRKVIELRFAQPTMCLGAFQRDRFVGYLWLCFGPYEEDEVRCTFVPLPESEAVWDFDVYVIPEARSGLAFARLWDEANRRLRARGVRFSFSRVSRFNTASRRAHDRLGWWRVGRALYFKGRRWQIMVATVWPHVYVSAGDSRRPRIRLRPKARVR